MIRYLQCIGVAFLCVLSQLVYAADDNKSELCEFISSGYFPLYINIIYIEDACPKRPMNWCGSANYKAIILSGDRKGEQIGITTPIGINIMAVGHHYLVFLKKIRKGELLDAGVLGNRDQKFEYTYEPLDWVTYKVGVNGVFIKKDNKYYRRYLPICQYSYSNYDCGRLVETVWGFGDEIISPFILYENYESELKKCN